MPTKLDTNTPMSPERQSIADKLFAHTWFKATDPKIQDEILSLPEDHQGYLEDLASRPDEIGELDVLRMSKLATGKFLILMVFDVRSNITNQVFTFEYASWKMGARPGARFILFLENKGEISHFIVAKNHRFSTNEDTLEAIGGLYLHVFENKLQNLPKKMEKEICFHLGVDELEFKKVVNLGKAHPDFGMTNITSDLFAATIDISNIPNLVVKEDFRTTHKPVGVEIKIVPISELQDHILNKIEDNYFLSAISRVLVHPEFSLPL